MTDTAQKALDSTMRDYIGRTVTSDMLRAAEEWHGGPKSVMRKFYFSQGQLGEGGDYRKLAKEVREARLEINNEAYAQWRKPLTDLELWADRVHELRKAAALLQEQAQELLPAGLEASEVVRLVQTALAASKVGA